MSDTVSVPSVAAVQALQARIDALDERVTALEQSSELPPIEPPVSGNTTNFTRGIRGASGPSGWSSCTLGGGTQYFVSSSLGDDSWDGTARTHTGGSTGPKATITAGLAAMADNSEDQLLLRRGDTWNEDSIGIFKHGISATQPLCIMADPGTSGARPIIQGTASTSTQPNIFFSSRGSYPNGFDYIFMKGLHLYCPKRDPNNGAYTGTPFASDAAIFVGLVFNWLFFEDMYVSYFGGAFVGGGDVTIGTAHLLTFRRCGFNQGYNPGTGTVGFSVGDIETITFEECTINQLGWHGDPATGDPDLGTVRTANSHNVYGQDSNGKCYAYDCISTNASYKGLQFRNGADIDNCYFQRNGQDILLWQINSGFPYGMTTAPCFVTNCVHNFCGHSLPAGSGALGGVAYAEIPPNPASVGGQVVAPTTISNCIVCNVDPVAGAAYGHAYDFDNAFRPTATGLLQNTIIYNWPSTIFDDSAGGWTFSNNHIELDNLNTAGYPNPHPTLGAYYFSIGGTNDDEAFILAAAINNEASWDVRLTAPAVNAYMRGKFGR